jgi:hypothetical protein
MEQMASQRAEEMRRSMARCRRSGTRQAGRHNPHRSVRQRAGWTLVEIGLRLAGSSGRA